MKRQYKYMCVIHNKERYVLQETVVKTPAFLNQIAQERDLVQMMKLFIYRA